MGRKIIDAFFIQNLEEGCVTLPFVALLEREVAFLRSRVNRVAWGSFLDGNKVGA